MIESMQEYFSIENIDEQIKEVNERLDEIIERMNSFNKMSNDIVRKAGNESHCMSHHPFGNKLYCVRLIEFIDVNGDNKTMEIFEKNETIADYFLFKKTVLEQLKQLKAIEIVRDEQIDDENYHLTKYMY